jgi:drug/metabolite transporter (DMT)-like permease
MGYGLALAAGMLFGLSDVMVRAAAARLTPLQNLAVSLVVGTPILWAAALASGSRMPAGKALLFYAAAGLLNFVVGRLLFYTAVTYAGASTAAVTTSPTAAIASLMAWVLLGEALGMRQLLGLALFVLAVYLASTRPSGEAFHGGRALLGVAAGVSAAFTFAAATILVRGASAYQGGDPISGAAISYSVALPIALVSALARDGAPRRGRHLGYMAAGAVAVACAQLSRYTALSLIPVAHATVLIGLFPFHTFLFALFLPGEAREKPQPRHGAAALLAAAGAALVNA